MCTTYLLLPLAVLGLFENHDNCCLFQVLRSVNTRESRLTQVEQALQAFQWHRGLDTDAIGVVSVLAGLREASLEVVRAVVVSEQTTIY